MAGLISMNLDVSKLPKEKFVKGKERSLLQLH